MGAKVSLEEELINLRIVSKQMQRSSKKCEKNEKAAIEKLKKVSESWSVCLLVVLVLVELSQPLQPTNSVHHHLLFYLL